MLHHGELLRKFLKDNRISQEAFAKLAGITRPTVSSWLHTETFKNHQIAFFAFSLGMDVDQFEAKDLERPQVLNANFDALYLKAGKKTSDPEYTERYFDRIGQEISKAKEEIFILDYVGHQGIIDDTDFLEAYERHLIAIETQINETPGLKYKRLFQLPLYLRVKEAKVHEPHRPTNFLVQQVPNAMISHLGRMMDPSNKNQVAFSLIKHAVYPASYIIIDKTLLISIYNRYDQSAMPDIDMLYVNVSNPQTIPNHTQGIIDSLLRRIDKKQTTGIYHLREYHIRQALHYLAAHYQHEIDSYEVQKDGEIELGSYDGGSLEDPAQWKSKSEDMLESVKEKIQTFRSLPKLPSSKTKS